MNDWTKYKADEVKNGFDPNGNRLLSQFASDFQKVMGVDLCPNCNDFAEKFQKFNNKTKEMENKNNSGFQLKKMYEGIPSSFGSSIYVTNQNITDDLGLELLQSHPRGKELFDLLPKNIDDLVADKNKPATLKIFEKDLSLEEIKDLFEKAEIKTQAQSLSGYGKAFNKLSPEDKEKVKSLLA